MRLTSFTDYSLRVLIYLASQGNAGPPQASLSPAGGEAGTARPSGQSDSGRRATIAEIAAAFGVSENHLTKVAHFLGKVGVLATVRGKGGGLGLARPAAEIAIGDVVRQTEGHDMPAECFDPAQNTCSIARICRLQGVLQEATEAFYAVLDRYTLEDLVHNRQALARVLHIVARA